MAITLNERYGTRETTSTTERREYTAVGTENEDNDDVYLYALSNLPTITGLSLREITVTEINTGKLWNVEAEWAVRATQTESAIGDVRVSSRTTLQPSNIKVSQSTTSSTAAAWFNGGVAVNFGQMVGVQEDGTVNGADVPIPHNVLSVTATLAIATVTPAYQYACEQLVGKTNALTYRSRAAGTLLCVGVTFGQVDDEAFDVSAEFEFEPNQTGLTVGGISGINKSGWDYIWTYNVPRKVSNRVVPVAAQVNVERFFPSADFAATLGF